MLYSGFYSLRFNAQEYFGSKFGRRRTPEKRLKDDTSDISEIVSNRGVNHKTMGINADDSYSDIETHLTPHLNQTDSKHHV